ncbi:MAG: phosphoadenosine phosphosulfate reductase family protein, partial [Bdellovibrionales bacterium]|nr:phosphoadenosine phosphosulfate reductase family protein [Bdellovibrionales bacterium]
KNRANIELIERLPQGNFRIHPLANWTKKDVWQYITKHNLPEHPLLSQGYLSIGCKPCTRPVFDQDSTNERIGRWTNNEKVECGLHTLLRAKMMESST